MYTYIFHKIGFVSSLLVVNLLLIIQARARRREMVSAAAAIEARSSWRRRRRRDGGEVRSDNDACGEFSSHHLKENNQTIRQLDNLIS